MIAKTMGVVWLVLAVGCVVPEVPEEETGQIEQQTIPICEDCDCPGCGGNGLRQVDWNYVFANLDAGALTGSNFDLWDNVVWSPKSLCLPDSSSGLTCSARYGWTHWIRGNPSTQRREIFQNLVKVILPKHHYVTVDGEVFEGKFGLMVWAREQPWGARGRSIASAGLLALLNAVPGVAICLNAEHVPDNCFNSGFNYSESVTFGDAINGNPRFVGIWGSAHAPFPLKNTRYGTVSPSSATVFNNALNTCTTALVQGRTETWARYPQYCRANGVTYHDPVHVLTPRHPNTWYYGEPAPVTPPVTPSGANQWPQPM